VAGAVVALAYGTVVHVGQLVAGGADPYPSMPTWLTVYFVSLTVLDPLAATLLALRRRAGPVLACAVLATDALANAYANYVVDRSGGVTAGRIGQAVITALALALLVATPAVTRAARRGRPAPSLRRLSDRRRRMRWTSSSDD
jgi:hypothetical protein